MSHMCDECRNKIKDEIHFLSGILSTPFIAKEAIDIANEVIVDCLTDLYSEVEEGEEYTYTTHTSDHVTTTTAGSKGMVISMADVFPREED